MSGVSRPHSNAGYEANAFLGFISDSGKFLLTWNHRGKKMQSVSWGVISDAQFPGGNSADSAGTLADVAATGHAAVIAATPYITPIIAKARASTMCSAIAPTRYSSQDAGVCR